MVSVKLQKEENREAFLKVFPTLADEVLLELRKYNMPEDAYEWTKKVGIYLKYLKIWIGIGLDNNVFFFLFFFCGCF